MRYHIKELIKTLCKMSDFTRYYLYLRLSNQKKEVFLKQAHV